MASNIPELSGSAVERGKSRPMGVALEHTALLILGMHRSGTSAVTRVMNLLGADLPTNIMLPKAENNEAGFWESMDVYRLNDKILKSAGSSWDDWRRFNPDWVQSPTSQVFKVRALEILEHDFSRSPCFVLKDPRICRLLPFWLDVLREFGSDVKCVLSLRNPLEIAASLKKRDGFSPAKSYMLWLRHVLDAEKATRKLSRVFVAYDDLMGDWRGTVSQVSERLEIEWPRHSAISEIEIERFLDERHRHYSIDQANIDQRAEVAGWVRGASKAIAKLVSDPHSKKSQKRLDEIRAEFNRASDALGAVLLAEELAREEAELSATRHTAESAEARVQLSKREKRLQELERQTADKDGTICQLRTTVTERDKKIAELEQRSAEQDGNIGQLRTTVTERDKKIAELEQRSAEQDESIDQLRTINAKLKESTSEKIKQIDELHIQIDKSVRKLEHTVVDREKEISQLNATKAELKSRIERAEQDAENVRAEMSKAESTAKKRNNDNIRVTDQLNRALHRMDAIQRKRGLNAGSMAFPPSRCCGKDLRVKQRLRIRRQARLLLSTKLFDNDWYVEKYPEVVLDGEIPIWHWLISGWRKGFAPNPFFDVEWYLRRNQDVAAAEINPLIHYLEYGAKEGRDPSHFFATKWYLTRYPDVANSGINPLVHYLMHGAAERRDPNYLFDTEWYLSRVPDAVKEARPPLVHYLRTWQDTKVDPSPLFDSQWYLAKNPDVATAGVNPWVHFLRHGAEEGRDPTPMFDSDWYLRQNPDVAVTGAIPLIHFLSYGCAEGRNPCPMFDTDWYLEQYPNVSDAKVDPFVHFIKYGWEEGKNPSTRFDVNWYLETYPDVEKSGVNPLAHYLKNGATEGLLPRHVVPSPSKLEFEDIERHACAYFKPRGRTDAFKSWQVFNAENSRKRMIIDAALSKLPNPNLKFSIIVPVYDPPLDVLDEAVASVIQQSYVSWELILVDDHSTDPKVRDRLNQYSSEDIRIRKVFRTENGHISAATNSGVDISSGEILVFLDNDDKLDRDALALFAIYISENPDTDIIYSDDAKIDSNSSGLIHPKFKPDWSPELLLSYCYISHLKAVRRKLYLEIGGSRIGFEGSQDHDMLLRAGEKARHIGHIPQVLYHRRILPTSTAFTGHAKPYSFEAGRRAVEEAFSRRGVSCKVIHPSWAERAGVGIFLPVMPNDGPSVALIIPTKNNWKILDKLLTSLEKTTYHNYRCYIVDNESDDPDTVNYLARLNTEVFRIANKSRDFSFAHINNEAVKRVSEEYVLFLNDDVEVIEASWLSQMVGWSRLKGIGAVGARLLYPDGRVQHAGVVFGLRCGLTAFRGLGRDKPGYLWYAKVTRNTSAVTAAAMLTPRRLFTELGGFDEERFAVAYNDVDYCARLGEAGYRIVYCGEAELFHHESYTRPRDDSPTEVASLRRLYGETVDPMFSPHLSKDDNQYSVKPTVVPVVKPERPINVLVITHNLNHEGAPNSAFELIQGLASRGIINPTVVSPQNGPLREAYEANGLKVHVLEPPRPTQGLSCERDYQDRLEKFSQEVNIGGYDLLYANTATTFWAIEAAAQAGIPSIWNIRESESWTAYYDDYPSEVAVRALDCFKYPYRVVFVADATRRRWSPVDQIGNFEVIHNGLDLERFSSASKARAQARSALGLNPGQVMVLCLGTTAPRKGQIDLIEAYLKLPATIARKVRLYFVGVRQNHYNDAMRRIVDTADSVWAENIFFVNETGETRCYWDAADIFVCTSRMESYPRVILEAMAKRLPIITTPVFGIVEQVRENINALFYNAGDVSVLTKHLSTLIQDDGYRERLAESSRTVLEGLESYRAMMDRYESVFASAAVSAVPPSTPRR